MKSINIVSVLKGVLLALMVTFAVIAVSAVLTYFSPITESAVTVILFAGVMAGVFIGAILVVRGTDSKKLLSALLVGFLYIAMLVIISLCLNKSISFNMHFITLTAGSLVSAFLSALLFA